MDWILTKFTGLLCAECKFYHGRIKWKYQSADQFKNQNKNTVQQGGNKNTFCGLIAVGIYIESKDDGVGQERNTADGGEQGFICFQQKKIIGKTEGPGKIPEIINQHGQQGRKDAQHDA
jgi:hypothetical protein